ncbi:hypothetical protein [Kaarinaea lacus]
MPLISGCYNAPVFSNNETINATVGKTKNVTVNVTHWNEQTQLVLSPGGPYLKNKLSLPQPALFVSKINQYIFTLDNHNNLIAADFSQDPAKQISHLKLKGLATALATYKQYLIVGFKQQGIAIYDTSRATALERVTQFEQPASVTQIKVYNDKVYALSNNNQVSVFEPGTDNNSTSRWRHLHTVIIPALSTDFAVHDTHLLTIGPGYGLGSLLISTPEKFISSYRLQGEAKAINVSDGFAYVASGSGGLTLFNINNPDNPQWTGSHNKFDTIDKVLVNTDRAFVIDRGIRIATLNIANKTLPITGSFYKPGNLISDMLVEDDHIYLATEKGIEEIHFPRLKHAQISNEGINQGGTRRAYIENGIAYVADWFSGLHLYDISNPEHPRHLSNFHTPGSSKGVIVENGYAYVGDDDHGLQIIDVSDPEHPKKVSEILTTGLAYTLKKQANLIYLADHRGGFHIIDVGNVKQPAIVSSYDTPGKSWAIDIVDNIAYVADDTSGLLVFDISNARHPKQIGQFNPQGAAEDVVIRNDFAYVSFFDKGFYILNIQEPSQPKIIAQLPIPGNARSVALAGNYAYIAGWESGLNIVDISKPASPRIVGSYDTKGSAWGADVSNNHVFIWDWWGGVKVVNVEQPQQPRPVGEYHTRGNIINLRQKDNYIYTANGIGGVQVFDINNALNPIWVTGIDLPGKVVDVWPSKNRGLAYTANSEHGLHILDISNPFYIQLIGQHDTGGETTLAREHNQTVYIANKTSGLLSYNASNPRQLVKQQELAITVKDMQALGNHLLVASEEYGLLAYSIDNTGVLSNNYITIDNRADRVIANQSLVFSSINNKIKLWRQTDNRYTLITEIVLDETITDMQATEQELLVSTPNNGLLGYSITDPAQPVLHSRYPSTDLLTRFIIHDDAAFFGGSHTIASAQRLPPLDWQQVNSRQIQLTVPSNLSIGSYHLMLTDNRGDRRLWPNALKVSFPHRKKPKMTMEDFKKLLEKHRLQQP